MHGKRLVRCQRMVECLECASMHLLTLNILQCRALQEFRIYQLD